MTIVAHERGRTCPKCGFGNSQRSNKCVVCGHGLSKFRNKKVKADGIVFDSQKEARRYDELLLAQKAGLINTLEVHPKFPLFVNGENVGTFVADFSYYRNGAMVVEDVKSRPTARVRSYRMNKRLMRSLYSIEIQEVL